MGIFWGANCTKITLILCTCKRQKSYKIHNPDRCQLNVKHMNISEMDMNVTLYAMFM